MIWNKTFANIVLLAVISAGFVLLTSHLHGYRYEKSAVTTNPYHDSYLRQATLKKTNDTGAVETILTAKTVHHYPDNNRTELHQPRLHIYDQHHDHWIITANHATSLAGTSEITLSRNVHIIKSSTNQGTVDLRTAKLIVHPVSRTADTDAIVTIQYPQLQVQGRGLHADLQKGTFKLLANIGTQYTPQIAANNE